MRDRGSGPHQNHLRGYDSSVAQTHTQNAAESSVRDSRPDPARPLRGQSFQRSYQSRFEEIKEQTPGPGQYLTVQDGFVKPSPQALQRSASFRVSSAKRGSKTDLSR